MPNDSRQVKSILRVVQPCGDPPKAHAHRRTRPIFTTTLAPDVVAALRKLASDSGASLASVTEDALRKGLGVPAE